MDLRKLDALVAEKVMGWTKNTTLDFVPIYYPPGPPEMNIIGHVVPLYSTDSNLSQKIFDAIERQGLLSKFLEYWPHSSGPREREQGEHQKMDGKGLKPLEVCLAALKVKGVDVSEWEK